MLHWIGSCRKRKAGDRGEGGTDDGSFVTCVLWDLWLIGYGTLATTFLGDSIAPFGQKTKERKKNTG